MHFSDLSDDDLLSHAEAFSNEAKQMLANIIVCLGEIEERQLHIKAAYPRFVEFCALRFRMSESEAFRRIVAARLVRQFPHILDRLERGEIHLTGLYLLRRYLTPENHEKLIAEACGKSKRHLQELIAGWFPRPDAPTRIVPVIPEMTPTALPFATEQITTSDDQPTPPTSIAQAADLTAPVEQERSRVEPLSSTRYKFEFTGDSELRAKVEEATELLRHANPSGEMAVVIGRALDVLIADLKKKKLAETNRPQKSRRSSNPSASSSYIPAATERAVYRRDKRQCTFVSADGRRCASREFVEIDHIVPRARGGTNELSNLRVVCRTHNQFYAQQAFGREHVAKQIELRRRNRKAVSSTTKTSAHPAGRSRSADALAPIGSVDVEQVELRQRNHHATNEEATETVDERPISEVLLRGLVSLGFGSNEARRAVDVVMTRMPRGAIEDAPSMIKEALAILT